MQLWNRRSKGVLLVVLINAFAGVISTKIATQIYRRWGWSLSGSELVLFLLLLIALFPVTHRILRWCWDNPTQSK